MICCLNHEERIEHWHAGNMELFYSMWRTDKPIEQGVLIYSALMATVNLKCVFVTSRQEFIRTDTLEHLTLLFGEDRMSRCDLLMRPNGDPRPDTQLKLDLIREAGIDFKDVFICFDDRPSVISAYREQGMVAYQTAVGW